MAETDEEGRRGGAAPPPIPREVRLYVILTFVLTIPFWLVGGASGAELLPGLPFAALAAVCPSAAVLLLSRRRPGGWRPAGARARGPNVWRIRRPAYWALFFGIPPAVAVADVLILRLEGAPVPDPEVSLLPTIGLIALFLGAAILEEAGWTGFALRPLQSRMGWRRAALTIGAVWALWHVPALIEARRSAVWIGGWTLGTLATRVIIVRLVNRAGAGVLAAAVFHALGNVSWRLFPVHGSSFDPLLNGLLLALIACGLAAGEDGFPRGGRRRSSPLS